MLGLILATLVLGAALGMRFKVLILVPITAVAVLTVVVVASALGSDSGPAMLAAALASVCLQMGYLCGTLLRLETPPGRFQGAPKTTRPRTKASVWST